MLNSLIFIKIIINESESDPFFANPDYEDPSYVKMVPILTENQKICRF